MTRRCLLRIGGRRVGRGAVSVIGSRWSLVLLGLLFVAVQGGAAGGFSKKPKSEAHVKRLIDAIRSDPDERKRRAAIGELRDVDPRLHPDMIPTLLGALQKDPAPQVRADAAEAIGQFKLVFPLAGLALEAAAESDPSRAVRQSAQQALWEYHLTGYRSSRGADGIAGQTAEPPIARPAAPRHAGGIVPATTTPAIRPVTAGPLPPTSTVGLPTVAALPVASAVPAMAASIPDRPAVAPGPRVLLSASPPPQLNLSAEPPVAGPRLLAVAPSPR